jgi:Transcriptional regulator
MTRRYELKQRAASLAQTRQRIVDATVALHGSVGPARTTISAIAELAGVQRLTVYRHFPDELALFQACSGHWATLHPAPDPATWAEVADPAERLGGALREPTPITGRRSR